MTERSLKTTKNGYRGSAGFSMATVSGQSDSDMVEIPRSEILDILKNLEGVKRKLQNKL